MASFADSPVIDLILHHGAVAGRPGAGPALAVSLVLVAIVVRVDRALLCGAGEHDSDCGVSLHVHVCDAG